MVPSLLDRQTDQSREVFGRGGTSSFGLRKKHRERWGARSAHSGVLWSTSPPSESQAVPPCRGPAAQQGFWLGSGGGLGGDRAPTPSWGVHRPECDPDSAPCFLISVLVSVSRGGGLGSPPGSAAGLDGSIVVGAVIASTQAHAVLVEQVGSFVGHSDGGGGAGHGSYHNWSLHAIMELS